MNKKKQQTDIALVILKRAQNGPKENYLPPSCI